MEKILDRIKILLKKIDEDNVSEFAAEISFFMILSLVPFIIFFFSIFQYTNIENEFIFFIINEIIPKGTEFFFYNLINEHYSKEINIVSISGIVALWSAAKGIFSLMKGIRNIYGNKLNKSVFFMKIEACIYTLILIFFIVLFLIFITFFKITIINTLDKKIADIFELFSALKPIILLVMSFVIFFGIYVVIPKNYRLIKEQFSGAIFSACAWYVVTLFFSIYINIFENFSNIYGSLGTIVLIMMWLYACMYIILIGAEINRIINDRHK